MKNVLKKNWFQICILCLLAIVVSSALYFFIFLPNTKQSRVDKQAMLFEQKLKCNDLRPSVLNSIQGYNSQQKPERLSQNNSLGPDELFWLNRSGLIRVY